jgi:hypothetical protein
MQYSKPLHARMEMSGAKLSCLHEGFAQAPPSALNVPEHVSEKCATLKQRLTSKRRILI